MANAFYTPWKSAMMQGTAGNFLSGTVKAVLVDTGTYTFVSTHNFRSSLTGVAGGTAPTLGGKSFSSAGVFDAADTNFVAVTAGVNCEAIVLYIDNGSAATDVLVAYIDTVSGPAALNVTPNGGDILITWNGSGIFQL